MDGDSKCRQNIYYSYRLTALAAKARRVSTKTCASMNPDGAMTENWWWRESNWLTVKFTVSLASTGGGGEGGGGQVYVTTDCVRVCVRVCVCVHER